jgi:flagellar protein FliL
MSDAKPAAAAPAKSSKKLLIIIAAAVVVLGGGGAGAWFAFGGKDEAKEAEAAHAEPEVKLPAQFVALEPFVVNFGPGSSARFLQIAVQLMTRDVHMVEVLKQNTPIIRNDLLLLFGNKQAEEVSTNEAKEALREAALVAIRKILTAEGQKPEALEAVYFTSFVMQ